MGTSDLPRILQQRGRLQRVPRPFRPGVQLAADWVKGLYLRRKWLLAETGLPTTTARPLSSEHALDFRLQELPPKDRREVESIKWFHQIDLGNGIITPGIDNTRTRLEMLSLPGDLRGRSVLDICALDGAFSFEAERLGANRVMAVDSFCWSGGGWGTKRGFECARRLLQSRVEDREVEVMDLSPETVGGTYDLVLFLGVLYHMEHPLAALERVASVCANQLILWTHINLAHLDVPAMAFYPDRELADDPTNWWGPNPVRDRRHVAGRRVQPRGERQHVA